MVGLLPLGATICQSSLSFCPLWPFLDLFLSLLAVLALVLAPFKPFPFDDDDKVAAQSFLILALSSRSFLLASNVAFHLCSSLSKM